MPGQGQARREWSPRCVRRQRTILILAVKKEAALHGLGRRASIFGLATLAGYATAQVPASATGITGSVVVSPALPGPQRAGMPDSRPYAGATILLRDAQGRAIARAVTDQAGRFTVDAPAGEYAIGVDTQGAPFPRCEPVELTIRKGATTTVELHCDSGMR